jgi:O-antigen ligase
MLDYRSLGALCVLVGSVAIARTKRVSRRSIAGWATAGAMLLTAIGVISISMQSSAEFADRRQESNASRLASIQVATDQVLESPLIGHGSWASNSALLDAVRNLTRNLGSKSTVESDAFGAHSMVLQAWFEGGLLALAFPLMYGFVLLTGIGAAWNARGDTGKPIALICLWLFGSLNHLLFSPFNGSHRIDVAFSVVMAVISLAKESSQSVTRVSSHKILWYCRRTAPEVASLACNIGRS